VRIVTLPVGVLETNCYIVADVEECLVVDPGDNGPSIMERIDAMGARVSGILLTHGHFDHTGAAGFLQEKTGAKVMIGEADAGWLSDPDWMLPYMPSGQDPVKDVSHLKEGDTVKCGNIEFNVYLTPGHSPGSICLYAPGHLFSGDLIFKDGVGRDDLPGGDPDELLQSVQRILSLFPDETVIYPGHGPSTTIAREKTANPFF